MKIFLTHGYFLNDDPREREIMRPYPPLGLLYIAGYLEAAGKNVTVFDSTFSSFAALTAALNSARPGIIAIYINLMTKVNVVRLCRFIRSSPELCSSRIILGGPEVKHHAENFLSCGADYIVVGEGEETMLELVNALENKDVHKIHSINGVVFLSEGSVISNPARKHIKEIDSLPLPARHKIDLQLYFNAWRERHGVAVINVSTMRGCPYTCKWCSRAVYGQSYRRRSPALVVNELKMLQEQYGETMFWFVDDVFTVSHKWLAEFVEELEKQRVRLSFECITRADRLNEQAIILLKKAGCFRVWIGAESGSQKIIDAMDRRVEVNQVRSMIRLTREHGVEAGTFIMLGYPGETLEDIKETVLHLITSDPDLFTITVAYPIKGTGLYAEVESRFLDLKDWETSTDRDIDFKRTYSRKFYDHAVRWVNNEVLLHKALKKGNIPGTAKLFLKSRISKAMMLLNR